MMSPDLVAVRALYSLQKAIRLMPCGANAGPIGGAGLALPASICTRTTIFSFFATSQLLGGPGGRDAATARPPTSRPSGLLHLKEIQFDRRLPAEERHHHAHLGPLHVDLVHRADEIVEWTVDDAHPLAGLVGDLDPRRLGSR